MEHQTFTDFDEFRSTNAQLDGQWLINGGKDWRWSTESAVVGDCQILRCLSQTGLIIEGVESLGAFHFYVPFKSGVWRNNGAEFGEDEVLIMEPGAEQCETSKTPDGWHAFLLPKHLLAIDPETRGRRARISYTVKTQRERTDAVRSLYERFMAAAAKHPNLEFSPGARMVEAELRSLLEPLLGCDDAPHTAPGRPLLSRKEIVQRAHVVLEEVGDEPIHVSELSARVGASERTLRTAFNDYYQIGPHRYLNLRQLHRARRDLLVSDPEETSVSEILVRWGVWQFGRFAGRYRRHFGELPSETLGRRHVAALR